jgi:hypothetical protein
MIAIGVLGIVVSIAGVIIGNRLVAQVEESVDDSLVVTADGAACGERLDRAHVGDRSTRCRPASPPSPRPSTPSRHRWSRHRRLSTRATTSSQGHSRAHWRR